MGKTWTEASPDLTRNEKAKQGTPGVPFTNEGVGAGELRHPRLYHGIAIEKGVIYTGSDDGLVYVTRDNCALDKRYACRPAGMPGQRHWGLPFDKATAYIATTRYKFNDKSPGLYKTTDYGKTWTKINNGIPDGTFYKGCEREDPVRKTCCSQAPKQNLYFMERWQKLGTFSEYAGMPDHRFAYP